jgi:serine/threonine protein kinase
MSEQCTWLETSECERTAASYCPELRAAAPSPTLRIFAAFIPSLLPYSVFSCCYFRFATFRPTSLLSDIKSANVLVDSSWSCKLSDFGLSKTHHAAHASSAQSLRAGGASVAGTLAYMAPECLEEEDDDVAGDASGPPVDMWLEQTSEPNNRGS